MHWLDYADSNNRVLDRILAAQAHAIPNNIFLKTQECQISYEQADAISNRYARGLMEMGVKAGEHVAIYMHSCPEFVLLTLAINRLGGIWVPINTEYRGTWLQQTLDDTGATVLVTDAELLPQIVNLEGGQAERPEKLLVHSRDRTPISEGATHVILDDFDRLETTPLPAVPQSYGDTSAVMWTSGTTGRSKGVMQSHNVWVRAAVSAARTFKTREGDVIYNCLPLYNSAAWSANIYKALVAGVCCAIDPVFSASQFWDRTRFYQATQVFTLGAMHIFLWQAEPRADDSDNPVRVANMIPMPEDLIAPFCGRFGIESIHQGYGQSEVMTLLVRSDDGTRCWKPNSLGAVESGLDVQLLNDQNQPVATGDTGEFCVRPLEKHVIFNGYFNAPDATREAFVGEWYHTGDLGRQDEDGEFFFVDRKKDVLRYKGRNVSSVEVESVARSYTGVADVACYGIPSEELEHEHEIMLAIVLEPNREVIPEELARFINENAPYYFVPRYIDLVDELPLTPTNKVRKNELRKRGLTETTWDREKAGFTVVRG